MLDNEKIYQSPQELLSNIEELIQKIHFAADKEQTKDLSGRQNVFECIRRDNGLFSLIPILATPAVLFRGENEVYPYSKPSLFRKSLSRRECLIERLKIAEMELLLKKHPFLELLKKDYNMDLYLSPIGLAQHYGVKTPLVDFTSDPNIAMFFATCQYNASTDSYQPCNIKKKKGVLWMVNPAFTNRTGVNNQNFYEDPVIIIGGQPFARPAKQKGFALRLSQHQSLQTVGCIPYYFNYTDSDSIYFFEKYKNGESLWCKNITDRKASLIAQKEVISEEAFCHYKKMNRHKGNLFQTIKEYGIRLSDDSSFLSFSKEEIEQIKKEYSDLELYYRYDIPKDPSATVSSRFVSYYYKPLNKDVQLNQISRTIFYSYLALMDMFYIV